MCLYCILCTAMWTIFLQSVLVLYKVLRLLWYSMTRVNLIYLNSLEWILHYHYLKCYDSNVSLLVTVQEILVLIFLRFDRKLREISLFCRVYNDLILLMISFLINCLTRSSKIIIFPSVNTLQQSNFEAIAIL